jgi:type I restriction enzyme S subunit
MDDLIKELCPTGVALRTLGDVGTIFGGLTGKSKLDFSDGNARFVSYMNVFNNIAVNIAAGDFVRVGAGERQHSLRRGDILFTGTSETPDEVAMSSVVTVDPGEPLYLNSFCIGCRPTDISILDPEFAKHLFRSSGMRTQLVRTANGVTRFNVSKARLAGVKVPIPPIDVQQEIVRILEPFVELQTNLLTELETRRLQYAFYRGDLMALSDSGKVAMHDVATFERGTAITAKQTVTGNVPVVANGPSPIALHNQHNRTGETVVIARSGAYAGFVSFWDEPIFLTDAFSVRPKTESLRPKFLFHWFRAQQDRLHAMKKGAGVPHVRVRELELWEIPMPTVAEQERIIGILDRFETLVNDTSFRPSWPPAGSSTTITATDC